MIYNSIKWRLQAWHGFLLVCLVTGLLAGFYVFERREKLQAIDNELTEAVTPLLPRFAPPGARNPEGRPPANREPGMRPPRGDGPPRPEDEGPPPPGLEPRRPGNPRPGEGQPPELREREERFFASGKMYYVVWGESGARLTATTNAPADLARPRLGNPGPGRILRTRETARELIQFAPNGRCVLIGTSLAPTLTHMHQLGFALALIGLGVVVAGLAVGWWLATRALRPIEAISRTARDIAAGDLSRRINTSETESELGQLAAVLNSTFTRLETTFAQQRQFTSDAAHELRTPVSVILTQIQSTLNKERSGAEYRETLEACQRAAQRMRRLIESLLQLARLDAGQTTAPREPVDLATCAADCVDMVRPLASERRIMIHTELAAAACVGDADQLALVLTNLLTNAIHYHHEGGEVCLTTRLENDTAIVTVADNGPGIATEHLPHIFDRFYRANAARTSSQGRTGLGLAIAKGIVEAHGGILTVTSELGAGATFEIRLPAIKPSHL